jgi:hypothetical protein
VLGLSRESDAAVANRAILMASNIVGGNNNTALMDAELIGRRVDVKGVKIDAVVNKGLGARVDGTSLFILPAAASKAGLAAGATISIAGVVLAMPRNLADRLQRASAPDGNDEIYVYGTRVAK